MGQTGHTGTLTLGTSGWSAKLRTMALGAFARARINCSHLESTPYEEAEPAPLASIEGTTVTFLYDPNDVPPFLGAVETMTIEFPLQPGESVKPKLEGTAWLDFTPPTLASDAEMLATAVIQWDGKTGPAFTDGAV